ncbi:hypothetical protein PIB30_006637 [Stylosanthes scabra]|uniref:Uncharacterized protein n=1 Tax=Stylosanthes scabra TaxID=79078 RepID=A0ABU6Q5J2_9FABA|nr:hypothetical protein [Stylosanthes scabra]
MKRKQTSGGRNGTTAEQHRRGDIDDKDNTQAAAARGRDKRRRSRCEAVKLTNSTLKSKELKMEAGCCPVFKNRASYRFLVKLAGPIQLLPVFYQVRSFDHVEPARGPVFRSDRPV